MAIPKWQGEVEAILRKQYQGNKLSEQLEKARELIGLVAEMYPPCDEYGKITAVMMKLASEELQPLAATYSGFMLGVAYERCRRKGGA